MIKVIIFYSLSYYFIGEFMKYLKILARCLIYTFLITITSTFIITIFSYFNIFSDNITKVLKLSIPIISVFIGGIIMGRNSLKKGFIEGIKLGLIICFILVITSIILKEFKISSILFYIILITSTTFGSMIGINKKSKTSS